MRKVFLLCTFALIAAGGSAQTPATQVPPEGARPSETPETKPPRTTLGDTPPGFPSAFADNGARVIQVPMDDTKVMRVPTHPTVNTTCIFPERIEGLDGAGFTQNLGEVSGEFLISFSPGASHFTLTPLQEGARRNINVIVGGKCYVIEPYPVVSYVLSAACVKFQTNSTPNLYKADGISVSGLEMPVPIARRSTSPPRPKFDSAGAGKLISLLDMMKVLSGLKGTNLTSALAGMPHMQLAIRGTKVDKFDTFSVKLDRVLRNNRIDAVAFEVTVRNTSGRRLVFDAESFAVRAGDELHPQVVADFNPILERGKEAKAYFAIITSADGAPNYLAVTNDFRVSVEEVGKLQGGELPVPEIPPVFNLPQNQTESSPAKVSSMPLAKPQIKERELSMPIPMSPVERTPKEGDDFAVIVGKDGDSRSVVLEPKTTPTPTSIPKAKTK